MHFDNTCGQMPGITTAVSFTNNGFMKYKSKLSRNEMKAVMGGDFPQCIISCYQPGGGIIYVTTGNYPVGSGCTPYACPTGTVSFHCKCESGGGDA